MFVVVVFFFFFGGGEGVGVIFGWLFYRKKVYISEKGFEAKVILSKQTLNSLTKPQFVLTRRFYRLWEGFLGGFFCYFRMGLFTDFRYF